MTLVNDKLKGDLGPTDQIASSLYQMALANEIEDLHLKQIAWWASDALDLADVGHIELSREQILSPTAVALDRAATEAAITWSAGVRAQGVV